MDFRGPTSSLHRQFALPNFILTYVWDPIAGTPTRQTPLILKNLARN
jgi:hypothetical protein